MTIIILDYETSGLNPYHDDIIEIGAKVYNTNKEFNILLKPKSNHAISEKIRNITGITNKMLLENGYKWELGYQMFIKWMNEQYKNDEDNIIVSHNGDNFDFILFRKLLHDLNLPIPKYIYIDTLALSKRLIPNRYSYSQSSLCKTYRICNNSEHRAMGDVEALEKLFNILEKQLLSHDITLTSCCDYCKYYI
jgi:DNA polymerase-3 subunit epsilon